MHMRRLGRPKMKATDGRVRKDLVDRFVFRRGRGRWSCGVCPVENRVDGGPSFYALMSIVAYTGAEAWPGDPILNFLVRCERCGRERGYRIRRRLVQTLRGG
jgi:hypothetical protein